MEDADAGIVLQPLFLDEAALWLASSSTPEDLDHTKAALTQLLQALRTG